MCHAPMTEVNAQKLGHGHARFLSHVYWPLRFMSRVISITRCAE